jgi:RNA polymerase sigma factor (TIGR02999 family)
MTDDRANVTQLLVRYQAGDRDALGRLFPVVYDELRRIAAGYMKRENPGHTLQATALVNEAYFRLVDQKSVEWQNRAHFFGVAAQIMRRILCDHARARRADKRGGNAPRLALDEALGLAGAGGTPDLADLDEALQKLAALSERQAKVVEMRFFAGLSVEEAAEALGSSPATVKRDWTFAKAWLAKELTEGGGDPAGSPAPRGGAGDP